MIIIKAFAQTKKSIETKGEYLPFSKLYGNRKDCEEALNKNRDCLLQPLDYAVKEIEIIIKD